MGLPPHYRSSMQRLHLHQCHLRRQRLHQYRLRRLMRLTSNMTGMKAKGRFRHREREDDEHILDEDARKAPSPPGGGAQAGNRQLPGRLPDVRSWRVDTPLARGNRSVAHPPDSLVACGRVIPQPLRLYRCTTHGSRPHLADLLHSGLRVGNRQLLAATKNAAPRKVGPRIPRNVWRVVLQWLLLRQELLSARPKERGGSTVASLAGRTETPAGGTLLRGVQESPQTL